MSVEFYQNILRQNSVDGVIENLEIKRASELIGEHFASISSYVTITLENTQTLHLFLKEATKNVNSTLISDLKFFEKEAGVYNVLLRDMDLFYEKKTKRIACNLELYPKCFFANDEMVILENLKEKNFIILDKKKRQDLETAKLVLKNLARFHSISYGLIQEVGEDVFLEKYPCLTEEFAVKEKFTEYIQVFLSVPLTNSIKFIEKSNRVVEKEKLLNFLMKLDIHKIFNTICESIKRDDKFGNIFNVACHGDLWSNNLLFQADPTSEKFVKQIFIDFQVSRLGSPNLDIGYFYYSSIKQEVRAGNKKYLLKYYLDSLKEYLEEMDIPFSCNFDDFCKDFERKSFYGLWFGIYMYLAHEIDENLDISSEEGSFFDTIDSKIQIFFDKYPDKANEIAELIAATLMEFIEGDKNIY